VKRGAPRLERLCCVLPDVEGARGFFDDLAALLAFAQGTRRDGQALEANAVGPAAARPRLAIERAAVSAARLRGEPMLRTGELEIAGGDAASQGPVELGAGAALAPVALREVTHRLAGRLRAFDHLAINLPASRISEGEWRARLVALGGVCNVYRYDDATAFAIPATAEEGRGEIDLAQPARKPKLELVRDPRIERPRLELALDTDLEPAELAERFPAPEGVPKPGAEAFFHAVALAHPWKGLDLTLDLGFRAGADFDLTALVATPERRVRPA
jgi:hypothetical protein